MSLMITIGIASIMLGVGLFIGKLFTDKSNNNNNNSIFQQWKKDMADKKAVKRHQANIRKDIETKAREEAMVRMQPELVKHIMEQERKKITGEDKKEKLNKFANAFSMGGSGFNAENKLNNMLGTSNNQPQQQQYHQPQAPQQQNLKQQQDYNNNSYGYNHPGPRTNQPPKQQQSPQQNDTFSRDKLNMMLGGKLNQNNDMNFNTGNTFSDDKINMMLGKTNKKDKGNNKNKEMTPEEKIKYLLG